MFSLIPTKAQWKKWSLANKLTCVGAYVGAVALALSIVFFLWPTAPKPQVAQTSSGGQSPSTAVVVSGNQISNRITVDQSISAPQVGSVGFNEGMVIAPRGSNITLNIFHTLPSTVTKEAFEALEKKLTSATNTIELTRADVRLLARALRDLDERTSGIEKLPDGRTMLGGVVAGTPRVVIEAFNAGLHSYTNQDYRGALEHLTNAVASMRAAEAKAGTNYVGLGDRIKPEGQATLYSLVADSAHKLGETVLANKFAEMAYQLDPSAQNQMLLGATSWNLGRERIVEGDVASGLEKCTNAITLLLSISNPPSGFNVSPNGAAAANMFGMLAGFLFNAGLDRLAKGDLHGASDRFTNAANALVELEKRTGPENRAVTTNDAARMFSYAAETSQRLGNPIQAYELARRAFEADRSAFHQAQMGQILVSLGRIEEARLAIDNAFKADPKDPQIAGLWKQITGTP
jgi:tetratricopeptide (TPR) repeat protein